MAGLTEWANNNKALAGGGIAAVLALVVILVLYASGGSKTGGTAAGGTTSGTTAGASDTSAASYPGFGGATGGTTGGYPGGGGAVTAMSGGGGTGGASDVDEMTKASHPVYTGRPNPMKPFWVTRFVPAPPAPPPIFNPPTPEVFVAPRPPELSGGANAQPNGQVSAPERMAGLVYSPDRVLAIVEQGSLTNEPAVGYVVQPGDMIGDRKVIAITPDSVTVQGRRGKEQIALGPGSLKGLPPAGSFGNGAPGGNSAFGAAMPGGGGPTDFSGGGPKSMGRISFVGQSDAGVAYGGAGVGSEGAPGTPPI
jgi:hypothetical protein